MVYNDAMQLLIFITTIFTLVPLVSHAQSLQVLLTNVLTFINDVLIPFILAIGFLFFVFNVVRYFVFQSTSDEGREKAKALATYSVLGFVVILVFWGIVNIFAGLFGFGGTPQPVSDYIDPDAAESSNIPRSNNNNTNNNNSADGSEPFDNELPCSDGQPFDEEGRPCGIY